MGLFKRVILRVFVFFMTGCMFLPANGDGNEYSIKAMFVLNFMKYIEWPSESNTGDFKIGVVGESEIFDAIQSMTSYRKEGRTIRIERIKADTKENFHIVIIPRSENKRIEEWVQKFEGKGVLIISDEYKNSNYATINLVNINNKIRFEINAGLARIYGLKISSKLSELAVSNK